MTLEPLVEQERWAEIDRIFQEAMDLPAPNRRSFVQNCACSSEDIRAEVLDLLGSAEMDLVRPAVDDAAVSYSTGTRDAANGPVRVGPYQVLESLGRGGMGQVFRAIRDDDEFHKEVALKMLRPEVSAHGVEVTRRFLAERQILATLEHPFIARLIDGGTHNGRPYLVMEYAREGRPIDTYVKELKLSTRAKLELFVKVCEAVQHAHQRLIVHRDLKPSNILVLPDGTPKLLDFGIAKLLDPALGGDFGQTTATGWMMMTPDYASPEQVKGEAITVSSDVYSLGVILYELVTGERPYRIKSYTPSEIQQAVCTAPVAAPSSVVTHASRLRRQLEGDIDTILLMSLRKEPERRYASVEAMAADLRRHLDGLPVRARRDTFAYRASKFVRRNRAVVILTALLGAAVLTGAFLTVREGRRSQKRFNEVRAFANSVLTEIDREARSLPGSTKLRGLLAQNSLRYLNSLAAETGDDSALALELSSAYHRVADILGHPYSTNLGDREGAMLNHLRALQIEEGWWNQGIRTPALRGSLALGYARVAALYTASGEDTKAVPYAERALAIAQPEDTDAYLSARISVSRIAALRGDLRRAIQLGREAYEIAERLEDPAYAMSTAFDLAGNAILLSQSKLGLSITDRALKLAESRKAQWAGNAGFEIRLEALYNRHGSALASLYYASERRPCEAVPFYQKQIAILEEQMKPEKDHSRKLRAIDLSGALIDMAHAVAGCGKEDGEPYARRATALHPGPPMAAHQNTVAYTQWRAGRTKEAMRTLESFGLTPGRESQTSLELASRFLFTLGDKQGAWKRAAQSRALRAPRLVENDINRERYKFLQAESLYFSIITGDPDAPALLAELKKLVATMPPDADSAALEPIRKLVGAR